MKPPRTMVDRLLDAADTLLERRPGSAAYRRRAVSTAYYAVFHALAGLSADCFLSADNRRSDAYARVYRALSHGQMKGAFRQPPLQGHPILGTIGNIVVELQSGRETADYSPPNDRLFPLANARELVGKARQAVAGLNSLSTDDRRVVASCLLFRIRVP